MTIHPRYFLVQEYTIKLKSALQTARNAYEDTASDEELLTWAEQVHAINEAASDIIRDTLKYQLRMERHGDPTKKENAAPTALKGRQE